MCASKAEYSFGRDNAAPFNRIYLCERCADALFGELEKIRSEADGEHAAEKIAGGKEQTGIKERKTTIVKKTVNAGGNERGAVEDKIRKAKKTAKKYAKPKNKPRKK
jgi:hypothetical protein